METQKLHKSKRINAYTVAAASTALGVSLKSIYNWMSQGRLQEVDVYGDVTLIDGTSVDKLLKQFELNPPKRGRKPKEERR